MPRRVAVEEASSSSDSEGPEEMGSRALRVDDHGASDSEGSLGSQPWDRSAEEGGGGEDGEDDLLADVPMEELARMASSGGAGPRSRGQERKKSGRAKARQQDEGPEETGKHRFHRDNKHRPVEMSSKRPVPRAREVVENSGFKPKDPRFESLSGRYDERVFRKRYSFLYDETMPGERERLRKQLKKETRETRKRELQAALGRIDSKLEQEASRRRREKVDRQIREKEKEAVAQGKKPFFPKRSVRKEMELVEKFKELESKGKLDKYLAKRRKRNASKDHRLLPSERRKDEQ